MKKVLLITALIAALFFIFSSKPQSVAYAAESEKTVEESVDEETEKLDTSALQEYFDSLSDSEKAFTGANVKVLIKALASGENELSVEEVANVVVNYAATSLLGFIPAVISVVIISILYGMLSGLNSGFLDKSTNQVVYFACYGAALIVLLSEVVGVVNVTVNAANRLQGLMLALFPVLLTLMTALGGVSGVGLYKPLLAAGATFVVSFIKAFILPCFIASIVLAVVGNLSLSVKLNKFSAFFKRLAEISLGLVFGVFLTILTAKGVVGRTADGIAVNAAKFALGSYVPILGGYISDGFDVIMAGCVLIKNAAGVTGLLVMLSVMLFPVIKLTVFTLSLRFAAAVAEPVSDGKISDLLLSVSRSSGVLVSTLLGLCFMFFAMIMLVVSSCNLGVV